jgi:hypothetical protein
VLAALAQAADAGAGAEGDVAAVEPGQLGDAEPGLRCYQQERPVAAAFPPGQVAGGEQGVDLGLGEERDELLAGLLGGDGQDLLDERGVFGVAQCRVGEQRPDRGQPQVAGPGGVVPLGFEVLEERGDQLGVEVSPVQGVGFLAGSLLGEGEQQLERIAVRRWSGS